ncbi:MAG: hypothetical protein DWQ19_09160 [Crenarchaeota archaeon]|nr:MAG: hypothetical protein DWQ19_09160 [Thermoproteota archaeon]
MVLHMALLEHSPDGFEVGYTGSGLAQLALAVLFYETGDPVIACAFYQDFKVEFVARLERGEDFAFSGKFVRDWLKSAEERKIKQQLYNCHKLRNNRLVN